MLSWWLLATRLQPRVAKSLVGSVSGPCALTNNRFGSRIAIFFAVKWNLVKKMRFGHAGCSVGGSWFFSTMCCQVSCRGRFRALRPNKQPIWIKYRRFFVVVKMKFGQEDAIRTRWLFSWRLLSDACPLFVSP